MSWIIEHIFTRLYTISNSVDDYKHKISLSFYALFCQKVNTSKLLNHWSYRQLPYIFENCRSFPKKRWAFRLTQFACRGAIDQYCNIYMNHWKILKQVLSCLSYFIAISYVCIIIIDLVSEKYPMKVIPKIPKIWTICQ